MQISNSYTKPQNQTTFGDRDDWGDYNLDPWVVERRELGKEYLAKKKEFLPARRTFVLFPFLQH